MTLSASRISASTLLLAGTVSACSMHARTPWISTHDRNHVLTGRIYDVDRSDLVSQRRLFDAAAGARFVLLGERHDNPDHHRLQARVVRAMLERGRNPAVTMEMLDDADREALQACFKQPRCGAAELADAVRWQDSGWPDWRIYAPVLRTALGADLALEPASLPANQVRAFMSAGGLEDSELYRRLDLDRPVAAEVAASMAAEIRASHCGYAPEPMITSMIQAQRLRDAYMADRMLATSDGGGAVLIAGSGHVRDDRGVAERLRAATAAPVLTIAFLEVDAEETDPVAYAERFGRSTLPFDYVWFTPGFDDTDPCEKFREQLQRMRNAPAS